MNSFNYSLSLLLTAASAMAFAGDSDGAVQKFYGKKFQIQSFDIEASRPDSVRYRWECGETQLNRFELRQKDNEDMLDLNLDRKTTMSLKTELSYFLRSQNKICNVAEGYNAGSNDPDEKLAPNALELGMTGRQLYLSMGSYSSSLPIYLMEVDFRDHPQARVPLNCEAVRKTENSLAIDYLECTSADAQQKASVVIKIL